jgi:hypothetical protein
LSDAIGGGGDAGIRAPTALGVWIVPNIVRISLDKYSREKIINRGWIKDW